MLLALDKFVLLPLEPSELSKQSVFNTHSSAATFFSMSSVWISAEASYQFLFRAIEGKRTKNLQQKSNRVCVTNV